MKNLFILFRIKIIIVINNCILIFRILYLNKVRVFFTALNPTAVNPAYGLEHHMISVIKYELDQKIESIENLRATSDLVILLNGLHSSLGEEFPIKQSYRLYPYGCL